MAKKPKKPPLEDREQSLAFLKLVADLEAAGDIDPAEAGEAFEMFAGKLLSPVKPRDSKDS